MSKESVPARYHPVHVVLHWLVALMVIGAFAVGMTLLDSTPNSAPEKVTYLQYHSTWGLLLALLLVARLVTRFMFKRPAPADAGNAFLNFVAKAESTSCWMRACFGCDSAAAACRCRRV